MIDQTVPRRSFLTRLAAASAAIGAAFGGAAVLPGSALAEPANAGPADDLDAWFSAMKGSNKVIYDCVQPGGGPDGIMFARNIIKFSAEKLGTKDADMAVIVSFRHFATPFGYNDAMWAKYPPFAAMLKVDDPKTKKPAARNWLLHEMVEGEEGANIPGVTAHGVKFAVCGAATAFLAKVLADKKGDPKKIEAELAANLIPGAKMMPAGVVGVQRAQKAGFAYTYAG
jgi:intracellular sulfur oxidation DsrE/DsrF family protein